MKRIALGALAVVLIFLGPWPGARASAASVTQYACRDAYVQDLGAGGTEVRPISCGREFSASDAYLVLYARIDRVDTDLEMTTELIDPAGTTVLTQRSTLRPRVGYMVTFTVGWVLPLSTVREQLPDKLRVFRVIDLAGAPAKERPGEWVWKITLAPGPSSTLRFTLKP